MSISGESVPVVSKVPNLFFRELSSQSLRSKLVIVSLDQSSEANPVPKISEPTSRRRRDADADDAADADDERRFVEAAFGQVKLRLLRSIFHTFQVRTLLRRNF